ncbi:MAG: polysaccharide biosynthesis C-terminal domain-containing protein [Bacteroidales bacterium]|nr:polysaccharide biosynthesis C-terminal domain-containing protein [Candidatus Latescibacterota bacterium]
MTYKKVGIAMSWNIFARVARYLAGPVSYIIVVRLLGSYNWGMLSVLKTLSGFALIIVMIGGGNAVLKFLPGIRVSGGMDTFKSNLKKYFIIQMASWCVVMVMTWIFRDRISAIYMVQDGGFSLYLMVAVGLVIFKVGISMISNTLQSWYETRRLSIVIALGNAGYLIIMMLLLKAGMGIAGYLLAGAIIDLLMTAALFPQLAELVKSCPAGGGNPPALSQMMKFSLPFIVTGFLNQIIWRHSEVLFLGKWIGMEASGYFGLAYDIPQMALEFVPLTIWPIVMAGTSEIYSRDSGRLPEAVDLYFRLLFLLVIPVAAMGFAFARPLVPILFGIEMLPAAKFTQLFFVVFSYSFLYTPLSMALYVMEKSWVNMIVLALMAIVNIGLDIALIPRYGIWGAFIPVVIVLFLEVVVFNIAVRKIRKDIRTPVGFILKCYGAAAPVACLAITASRWDSIPALAIQMIVGIVLLIGGFRFMKVLGAREKELIMSLPVPFKEKIVALF